MYGRTKASFGGWITCWTGTTFKCFNWIVSGSTYKQKHPGIDKQHTFPLHRKQHQSHCIVRHQQEFSGKFFSYDLDSSVYVSPVMYEIRARFIYIHNIILSVFVMVLRYLIGQCCMIAYDHTVFYRGRKSNMLNVMLIY